jgi:hypothetical protein
MLKYNRKKEKNNGKEQRQKSSPFWAMKGEQ